ncbi:MAG TPA: TetR/AcrR family transcriptional regulator [bacterium]|nr:TetR/AcrR family transcriptional regulator [bacterium]HQM85604.1 TetR/AcrR family transcriptional regulator [bacterium]
MARTSEEKKEMIIMNFVSLIQQHGINRVTLNDVAEKSGLTKSALYYYFESKEALLIEGFEHFNKKIQEKLVPLIEKAKSPKDILFIYCDFQFKVFFGGYEEFKPLMEISTEVFFEIQKYMFNSPDIAKKIMSHRDSEMSWLNSVIAEYIDKDPEDEKTKKITLMFAGFLHSFVTMSCNITKQAQALSSYSIISDFPWRLDNIDNKDVFEFLIGGIDRLKTRLFN